MQIMAQLSLQKVVTNFNLEHDYYSKFSLVAELPIKNGVSFGGKQGKQLIRNVVNSNLKKS